MDKLVELGFDGLHSLQPSTGMDIKMIKEKNGDRLCLLGNIDLDYIMTSKQKVFKTAEFCNTEQELARDIWYLPWFEDAYPKQVAYLKKEYPSDIITVEGINYKEKAKTEGDPYAVGRYVDEWGSIFKNVHKGIIGELYLRMFYSQSYL